MNGPLPVRRAHELELWPEDRRWLVDELWAEQAVGIVGGEPKSCKSFLALDVAVSVASGAPCLGRFPVAHTGPVLLFAAEDAAHVVRRRIEGIARAADVPFETLDIHVITSPSLRLDLGEDQSRLRQTVERLRPRLLVLDPFVRLHRIDENVAAEVAPVLGYLRHLQRSFQVAVLLVHHARKGAAHVRAGQALRGSSELHAWGDSNLYLRRKGETLRLSIEHRAASGADGLAVELRQQARGLALRVADPEADQPPLASSLLDRVEQTLASAPTPLTRDDLRRSCRVRMTTLAEALATLTAQGRVLKSSQGYQLASCQQPVPVPLTL